MRLLDRAYLAAASAFAAVGLLVAPLAPPVPRTMMALLGLYALPFGAYPTHRAWLMVPAFWIAAFLALQTLVSWVVLDPDHHALAPSLDFVVDVKGGFPGIEGPQHITTDEHGFRAYPPIEYNSTGALRIFAIGGSTTIQIYLDDRSTWTYLLQERLRRRLGQPVEVVNAGVSGLRARHHLATLKEIELLQPDLVLFLVGANDWNHQILENCGYPSGRRCLARPCLDETLAGQAVAQLWRWVRAPTDLAAQTRVDHGEYFEGKRGSLSRPKQCAFRPEAVSPDYAQTLEAIARECGKGAFRCVLITQPNGYSEAADQAFRQSFWATPFNTDYTLSFADMEHIAGLYNAYLTSFANSHGFPLCDLAAVIPPSFAAFYDEMHFNTAGAALVAERLEPCVAAAVKPAS